MVLTDLMYMLSITECDRKVLISQVVLEDYEAANALIYRLEHM
jgi:hypothetical protein